ncbi:MAG: rRNA cytosine-C5-methyltransferase [Bacteroidales bacterium]
MFPKAFEERIKKQEYIDSEALLNALEQPSPVSIRINTRKWQKAPLNSGQVTWCKTGYYLKTRPSYTLDPLFHSGCYYPQEASGMFIEQVFNQLVPADGQIKVLDLCAAPGGKSTHLSSLAGRKAILVSNEVIRSRASVLSENISRWGATNAIVTQNDPSAFKALAGFFDIVLVDAPCSGEGMFRDQVARNEWSEQNAAHCSDRQKRILMDIWPALRENGILIYSTCTFNPAENEHNIKWLADKVEAEPVQLNIGGFQGIREIDYKGITGYGFYPDRIRGEGLFFSALRKKGKSDKVRKTNRTGDSLKVSKADLAKALSVTRFPGDQIVRIGESVVALPGNFSEMHLILQSLRIVRAGTKIFTVKKSDILPSHDLALTTELKDEAFPAAELDLEQASLYLKRGNPEINDAPIGWFLIRYRGINIGFVNNIGTRINNYYPVEWRIRMAVPENSEMQLVKWDQ